MATVGGPREGDELGARAEGVRPGGTDVSSGPMYGGTDVPPGPMYGGYGGGWGYGRPWRPQHPQHPIETKPFFLTSEFFGALVLIVAMAISAASDDAFDARLFWALTTAVVCFYLLSRGIAKSGTKSRAGDPREQLFQGERRGQ